MLSGAGGDAKVRGQRGVEVLGLVLKECSRVDGVLIIGPVLVGLHSPQWVFCLTQPSYYFFK